MIDLYYWTTPNGHKITIFLEETGLEYTLKPVNISAGQQFEDSFLNISPNNKIPAIVDRRPDDGGKPFSIFESGAILEYLSEKTGRLMPPDLRDRWQAIQWLHWQMGGFGPMLGQNHHFKQYAPEKLPYAIERYDKEAERLYGVLDDQLRDKDYIAGEYSIADIATYPWARLHERHGVDLKDLPNVARWLNTMAERPAVKRAYAKADTINTQATVSDESKAILFGQGRRK
ncbi:glutathione binding-like protein [Marinobacter caseinilyticus]|uniref:glutathione binding-like protein n=1 Tax=Marinobacter caseinilyticus TaxID=2692195 RepID=UPI001409B625|nr:glutathione binding-like protein [Marinobacter caseinilyticus]